MTLKQPFAAVAAVVITLAASSASAATIEDQFVRICLPATSAADASTRARAEGYVTAPAEIRKKLRGFPEDGEMLWRADEGVMSLFVGAKLSRDIGSSSSQMMQADACLVASMPPQPDLQVRIERVLKVGPAQPFGKSTAYIFEQTPLGLVRLDGADKALIMVKTVQGSARMATALERSGMGGLMLMIPQVTAR